MPTTIATEKEYLLLTPGPTPVPENIRQEMAKPILHHRTPEFGKILLWVHENLKPIFKTKQSEIFMLAGSGTAAMEAAVVNFFSPGERVIVCSIGAFGERWAAIAKTYGLQVELLAEEWGNSVNIARLKETLAKFPDAVGVFATHLDTSTATVNPVAEIGKAIAGHKAIFLVDSISGLAGEDMRQDEWGVDVCVSGNQKGLMCPPGVAFLSVSPKAGKLIEGAKIPRFYLDLRKYRKSMQDSELPFTAPISLIIGMAQALKDIQEEGWEARLKRYQETSAWTRQQVKTRLGCKLFSNSPSIVLTAAWIPEDKLKPGTTSTAILKYIRDEFRITIADGQNQMKGKIFRIAHMGAITQADVEKGITALEKAFEKFKA